MVRRLALSLVVLASLLACGGDDDDDPVAHDDEVDAAVVVAADGIVVGDALPFGTPRADVVPAVIDALGEATEENEVPECPAGEMYAVRWGDAPADLLLDFQGDELVGWSLGTDSELTTEDGIGIGSTRAELEAARGEVDIDEASTLGMEFATPDALLGLLDGASPDALVTNLWAGTTCIFR